MNGKGLNSSSWSTAQRRLHWFVAGAVVLVFTGGWVMVSLPEQARLWQFLAYQAHKNLGLVVLVAGVVRLILRFTRGRPAWPDGLSPGQRRLAGWGHGVLHGLVLAVPVLGYLVNCVAPAGVPVLVGLVWPLPPLLPVSAEMYAVLGPLHMAGAVILLALAAGHGAMAVHHHRRGLPVLRGMWGDRGASVPGSGPR